MKGILIVVLALVCLLFVLIVADVIYFKFGHRCLDPSPSSPPADVRTWFRENFSFATLVMALSLVKASSVLVMSSGLFGLRALSCPWNENQLFRIKVLSRVPCDF